MWQQRQLQQVSEMREPSDSQKQERPDRIELSGQKTHGHSLSTRTQLPRGGDSGSE